MATMTERAGVVGKASVAGRTLALVGAAALVVAMFLPWTGDGRLALDLGLTSIGAASSQPTVALALVGLAALPSIAALVGDHPFPRIIVAGAAAVGVLVWLGAGPDGSLAPGVLAGLAGVVLLSLSAALASRPRPEDAVGPSRVVGFRYLDHTADTAIEAWGPTRAACLEAAVHGLVGSFAGTEGARVRGRHPVVVGPGDDSDLLVDLLDEVIYVLDAHGAVVVGVELRDTEAGAVEGAFLLTPVAEVRPVGAVPKAVTYHGLRIEQGDDGAWRCHVIIDV